ncbi:MAG: pyridoxamine 5'-phosphate oxidase [Flavobacteriales bacterium]|nr:pyridoxamine 5'-phosphate oxidase [Flavobacteriales bacterium]MBL6872783.1 pyridoxamine 5'-phosphate oxidase [Flavobacteriales bacterium]
MKSIKNIRTDYVKNELNFDDLTTHPFELFKLWMTDALKQVSEPNAFVFSTVNPEGRPSSRVLLLRDLDDKGFNFFTNYNSQKSQDIESNPFVCMNFFWYESERQVRVSGRIEKLPVEASDDYFQSRPYDSKIGAWSSPQSSVIESREILVKNVKDFSSQYSDDVPRPPHWGGYCIVPDKIEFWQGRSSRLHDRFVYSLEGEEWKIERLAP